MYVNTRISPACIDMNSLNFSNHRGWFGNPVIASFDLEEMDDNIGKHFLLRNFGTYQRTDTKHHISSNFSIPVSHVDTLSRGEVPPEIHEGFKESNIPFSNEAYCKDSLQRPGSWVLIDTILWTISVCFMLCFQVFTDFSLSFGQERNSQKKNFRCK